MDFEGMGSYGNRLFMTYTPAEVLGTSSPYNTYGQRGEAEFLGSPYTP